MLNLYMKNEILYGLVSVLFSLLYLQRKINVKDVQPRGTYLTSNFMIKKQVENFSSKML